MQSLLLSRLLIKWADVTLVAVLGIEPRLTAYETGVLPLDDTAIAFVSNYAQHPFNLAVPRPRINRFQARVPCLKRLGATQDGAAKGIRTPTLSLED